MDSTVRKTLGWASQSSYSGIGQDRGRSCDVISINFSLLVVIVCLFMIFLNNDRPAQ
ncbi:uncharacterized protein METZ01_LOCUS125603 [marine metagenome]|uniref:Uncharacterized protein n=1 Tax=marine metagenome TaxID=408172 RepID=A0A381Y6Q0_9ZZZZ